MRSIVVSFNPRNILVIDFGQLGDVVLSLPALGAIRKRFPRARITVAVGKPGAEVVKLSGFAEETLVVDRVALRDGFTPLSIFRIFKIVKDVREKRFDFVIDLHSLSETNLLVFCPARQSGSIRAGPDDHLTTSRTSSLRHPLKTTVQTAI